MEKRSNYTPKKIRDAVAKIIEEGNKGQDEELNLVKQEMFKAKREFVLSLSPKQLVLYEEFLEKKRACHSLIFHV